MTRESADRRSTCAGALALLALASCSSETLSPAPSNEALSGGDGTVFVEDENAFTHPVPTLDRDHERTFFKGRALFRDPWVEAGSSTASRDGLGPLFNARACVQCHVRDGRGRSPEAGEALTEMFARLSIPAPGGGAAVPEPTYGEQFQPFGVPGVDGEGTVSIAYDLVEGAYGDGEPYTLRKPRFLFDDLRYGAMHADTIVTGRVSRAIIGLGLLEAIPEEAVLGGAGRPNWGRDEATGEPRLGRFGWKATQPTVRQQAALAFLHDMGLSTSLFPEQPCTALEPACEAAPTGGDPEVLDAFLDNVDFYARTLAVPARRDLDDPEVRRGEALFHDAGCARCHVPKQQTGAYADIPELAFQTIYPYTDLMLHDMGEGLDDGRADYEATGRDWRTPPLWGIGLIETVNGHQLFLHDGRARGFAEAILWHGGEAAAASEAFRALPAADRAALIRFLSSL